MLILVPLTDALRTISLLLCFNVWTSIHLLEYYLSIYNLYNLKRCNKTLFIALNLILINIRYLSCALTLLPNLLKTSVIIHSCASNWCLLARAEDQSMGRYLPSGSIILYSFVYVLKIMSSSIKT